MPPLLRSCFPCLLWHALLQHVSQKLHCSIWSFPKGALQRCVLAKSGPAVITLLSDRAIDLERAAMTHHLVSAHCLSAVHALLLLSWQL